MEWAPAASDAATFEKMEAGRARILRGDAYPAAVEAAGDDARAIAAVSALLSTGKWERSNRIIVPALIAQHVLGISALRGAIYVHPTPEAFELWGPSYYAAWALAMRDHLPE